MNWFSVVYLAGIPLAFWALAAWTKRSTSTWAKDVKDAFERGEKDMMFLVSVLYATLAALWFIALPLLIAVSLLVLILKEVINEKD